MTIMDSPVGRYYKQHGKASVEQISRAIGISKKNVYRAAWRMAKRGYLEKLPGVGIYRWKGDVPGKYRRGVKLDKIWKFIRHRREWTLDDIESTITPKASRNYIKNYVNWLRNNEYIVYLGRKLRQGHQNHLKVFKVAYEHRFTVETPSPFRG